MPIETINVQSKNPWGYKVINKADKKSGDKIYKGPSATEQAAEAAEAAEGGAEKPEE